MVLFCVPNIDMNNKRAFPIRPAESLSRGTRAALGATLAYTIAFHRQRTAIRNVTRARPLHYRKGSPTLEARTTGKSDSGSIRFDRASTLEKEAMNVTTEKATFGAGCFWGVEAAFRQVHGVTSTAVGYMGGDLENPTYRDVCTDQTGHAEVVEVTFDPSQVSYADLLKVFWENHDPTQFNRQGPDYGKQYRTAIFFHSPEQEAAARASKEALDRSGTYNRRIVTEITPATDFWRAEDYHQQYLEKRGLASCHIK
jgi:peptide-methionine (S)-S-oxide reductase